MRRKTAGWWLAALAGVCLVAYASFQIMKPAGGREAAGSAETPGSLSGEGKTPESARFESNAEGWNLITENEDLALYIDPETTETAVKDKRSGQMWYSNPQDRDEDKKAEAVNFENLSAQFSIVYNNEKGQTFYANNYTEAVKRKQFDILKTDHGVKIIYRLGDFQKGLEAVPQFISKQRMDDLILSKIQDESVKFEIEKRFFLDEETQVYKRKEMPEYVVKDVVAILESVGYTAQDAKKDNELNQAGEQKSSAAAKFTVPVEYRLDGRSLVVQVPVKEIRDTEPFPIESIQLLEMFGAAGTKESGYMFVPDGSGALIRLNNGKVAAQPYEMPIYGQDRTLKEKTTEIKEFTETTRLPVFGMKKGEQAFFCIIEAGDAVASIHADISGRVNSYNRVSAKFLLKPMELFTYRAGSVKKDSPMFPEMYGGGIRLRYTFLSGASADYAGMARHYQDYLVQNGKLTKLEASQDTPFVLDLVGSIPVRETFLGIPYRSVKALTTFQEAESLVGMLKGKGIGSIKLRYSGWFNGGLAHHYPDDIDVDAALGGEKGFEHLVRFAKEQNVELYPDVSFLQVYRSGHGFKPSRDGASFLFREGIAQYKTDPVTANRGDLDYYLLSPKKLPKLVDDFLQDYKTWSVGGVSLRDLGDDIHSDVTSGRTTDRQAGAALNEEAVKRLKEAAGKTMVSGGNAGVLPYADIVVNAPARSSGFNIADEEVPFYQMVLHGYVDYSGEPVNLDRDQSGRASLLKTLETGSGVYYRWFYEKASAVRNTDFNDLYSARYKDWLDEAVRYYKEANGVLKDVRDQRIVGHEKLAEGVFRTTYENGKTVTVNYNASGVSLDGGVVLEGESYRIGGGKR
ncbi:DUF5696 domain-containing protein [Paenibacillus sp. VCA1]|uniref:DUF5696 domain-containing protein n=1 Tax=Paenibacillus sp. VCA1 TaxID=3039148 RepID=UPI00287232B7|nr:DUF5696 domain-containing protein [Paenibacillus sp. VCA1]MDR9853120.1 DUF5696 domain-containing protein [Paenibacillus sp. VCA1]